MRPKSFESQTMLRVLTVATKYASPYAVVLHAVLLASLLGSISAKAADDHVSQAGLIRIEHAWLRAAASGATVTVFVDFRNAGPADRLVKVEAADMSVSRFIGLRLKDGAPVEETLTEIELPAKRVNKLTPTTAGIRIEGLARVFKKGDKLTLRFTFGTAPAVTVIAETMAANARQHSHAGHSH